MKLTVLTDNNTYIDRYYFGEPGVSYLIEDEGVKILFDLGYSGVCFKNAELLGLELSDTDVLVFSHGHNDHTGGLTRLPALEGRPKLVAHPGLFLRRRAEGLDISAPVPETLQRFELCLSAEPVRLSPNILFLGGIPRTNDFENQSPVGEHLRDGVWEPDYVEEDSALVYEEEDGISLITGCSHAGICNMAEYAKKVTGKRKLKRILGGLHVFDADSLQMKKTLEYFRGEGIAELYPCHCTSFEARCAIHEHCPVKEVGVGLTLQW